MILFDNVNQRDFKNTSHQGESTLQYAVRCSGGKVVNDQWVTDFVAELSSNPRMKHFHVTPAASHQYIEQWLRELEERRHSTGFLRMIWEQLITVRRMAATPLLAIKTPFRYFALESCVRLLNATMATLSAYQLTRPDAPLNVFEVYIFVLAVSTVWAEASELKASLRHYVEDPFNAIDAIVAFLLIWFEVLRFVPGSQLNLSDDQLALQTQSIMSVAAGLLCFRAFSILTLSRQYGPILTVISSMVLLMIRFLLLLGKQQY